MRASKQLTALVPNSFNRCRKHKSLTNPRVSLFAFRYVLWIYGYWQGKKWITNLCNRWLVTAIEFRAFDLFGACGINLPHLFELAKWEFQRTKWTARHLPNNFVWIMYIFGFFLLFMYICLPWFLLLLEYHTHTHTVFVFYLWVCGLRSCSDF